MPLLLLQLVCDTTQKGYVTVNISVNICDMCDSTMFLIICDMCDTLQCKCASLCCVPEVIVHVAVSISICGRL